jgi:hypothetical protein
VDACYPAPQIGPGATVAQLAHLEPSFGDHLRKLWLRWEFADRLDKVLVRSAIRRENGAKKRYERERIVVVYPTTGRGAGAGAGGEWLEGSTIRVLTGRE